MWEPQLALADHGWRVVAPYLRGMGGGRDVGPATSMDDYAGDVIDLLDALHVEEVVLGGVSMGGYVAFAMLRCAPRYVRGLVLADTRPQADTREGVDGRKRMLALVREKGPAAVADEMLPRLLGPTTFRDRPEVVARVRALALSNSTEAIAGAMTALMTRVDSTSLLSGIRCPTLVMVGEEDVITPPQLSEAMQRAIPGSGLAVLPQAGHLPNLERPDAFNDALGNFLDHNF